ncbi:PhzF family phenazine biosynthesis protein [Gloeocapsopsis crepidinum LEGE 06123]|uniref:PhzF family phenazine biosynthesis protein n=1 Tax=Gloeocapsopsis crepidinum LEGE 06123 TaxID=588587 RepID=A0ABR9UTG3_9CHRO|nr:PhzF family phenazine biosynthesis protein [Gloeocapsopsis crepidinum]MBE9190643.1 PhzF family phenazine biosynthesis protein [Gloeocapsopsis crepidinum LEGE 06123]
MAKYRFYTADVFTDVIFGGNQLAVFPDARGIPDSLMQNIAREFNLSETAFVFPPAQPDRTKHLRIFTPGTELPFAGHPTIGTAHVLAAIGEILLEEETTVIFEEEVGPVNVVIYAQNGQPVSAYLTAAQLPQFGPNPPEPSIIAAILGLHEDDVLVGEWSSAAVSCGVPFLFVPVRDRNALCQASVNREHWNSHLKSFWAPHLYVFCFDPELQGSDLRARMFAPAMGIEEDPATGAAASALAGYLGDRYSSSHGVLRWIVEQGFEMNRPSMINVQAQKVDGHIVAVQVGGQSVMVSEGVIEIPERLLNKN